MINEQFGFLKGEKYTMGAVANFIEEVYLAQNIEFIHLIKRELKTSRN